MVAIKPRRVRDPVHDMIPFSEEQLERVLWRVVESRPFQRLRRVKQLGFSEFTYPGATHTRFSHSLGVFHVARQLIEVVRQQATTAEQDDSKERTALAAALVHDLGHGMFSHAFEQVGKELAQRRDVHLPLTSHERVTAKIITETEVKEILSEIDGDLASSVSSLIQRAGPRSVYDAVVSSQFDADRLDYMRRDRMMAGVQSGGIDFPWLLDNLVLGEAPNNTDDVQESPLKTLVLGRKAVMAGEQYVLALFQLYPTIYHHKATIAAEAVFTELMVRLFELISDGSIAKTGLNDTHPIARFAKEPEAIEAALALDDAVFWGALPVISKADDRRISLLARSLRDRRLPKAIELEPLVRKAFPVPLEETTDGKEKIRKAQDRIRLRVSQELVGWSEENNTTGLPRILVRRASRDPYSRKEEKGPLNRIMVEAIDDGKVTDISEHSPMIAALRPFEFFRAYVAEDDHDAREAVAKVFEGVAQQEQRT